MRIIVSAFLVLLSATSVGESLNIKLAEAAFERTSQEVRYDGSYIRIPYPGGDVPSNIGVCTDLVIRSFRALDIDLQQLVHEDMTSNFTSYPSNRIWGMKKPYSNIDHRRVPNLQTYFIRQGMDVQVSDDHNSYRAGDIVTWMLPGNLPHIGIISNVSDAVSGVNLIAHNIGYGPKLENMLFDYEITGHYRYKP